MGLVSMSSLLTTFWIYVLGGPEIQTHDFSLCRWSLEKSLQLLLPPWPSYPVGHHVTWISSGWWSTYKRLCNDCLDHHKTSRALSWASDLLDSIFMQSAATRSIFASPVTALFCLTSPKLFISNLHSSQMGLLSPTPLPPSMDPMGCAGMLHPMPFCLS